MINELLAEGEANAITGRDLAAILNCDIRDITLQVEAERREGFPICASAAGTNGGYYLAADQDELKAYCERIHHRAAELYKTRRALLDVLKKMAAAKEESLEVNNTIHDTADEI